MIILFSSKSTILKKKKKKKSILTTTDFSIKFDLIPIEKDCLASDINGKSFLSDKFCVMCFVTIASLLVHLLSSSAKQH